MEINGSINQKRALKEKHFIENLKTYTEMREGLHRVLRAVEGLFLTNQIWFKQVQSVISHLYCGWLDGEWVARLLPA